MADNVSLPLPRDGSPGGLLSWANALVNYLRRNVIVITQRISTIVTEYIQPINDDRELTLEAAEAYAEDVREAMEAANNYAQEIYDQYEIAAAAQHASLAQFYLTEAANKIEQKVRIDENEVLATSIQTVQASLAATNAAVSNEITARVNGDNALASSISTVLSQANGNSASIQTIQQSVDGIEANWAVVVNTNGHVQGYVRLDGGASGSNFIVVADRFIVSHPSAAGTLMTPFIVGLVNGVSTVGINGNVVIDGSLLARHIAANTITADKIAAGAITADKIAANAITTGKIAANAIMAGQIAAGAVTAAKISAGAVSADKLNVASLDAVSGNMGTLRVGKIESNDGKFLIDATNKRIKITT